MRYVSGETGKYLLVQVAVENMLKILFQKFAYFF